MNKVEKDLQTIQKIAKRYHELYNTDKMKQIYVDQMMRDFATVIEYAQMMGIALSSAVSNKENKNLIKPQ